MPGQLSKIEALAERLNKLELGVTFEAHDEEIVLHGESDYAPLHVATAGRGQPREVEAALGRARDRVPYLVLGRQFSPGALGLLREAGANYADDLRIHVSLQALLIHLVDDRRGPEVVERAPLSLSGAAGAIAIALLAEPERAWRVTELAGAAGVAVGTAQRVTFGLESIGLLERRGKGPATVRHVTDAGALLDRYARDARKDRRQWFGAFMLADSLAQLLDVVADALGKAKIDYAITGAAAAVEAPALTAVDLLEVWIGGQRSKADVLGVLDAEEVERGANIRLLRAASRGPLAGRRCESRRCAAARPRVYADLLAMGGRGSEQAEAYRESELGF